MFLLFFCVNIVLNCAEIREVMEEDSVISRMIQVLRVTSISKLVWKWKVQLFNYYFRRCSYVMLAFQCCSSRGIVYHLIKIRWIWAEFFFLKSSQGTSGRKGQVSSVAVQILNAQ